MAKHAADGPHQPLAWDGVRAVMTASWLVQMGWPEGYVLAGGLGGRSASGT